MGQVGSHQEVQLAPRPGDMPDSRRLRCHRGGHALRVVVQIVVELLAPRPEGVGLTAPVQGFVPACDLSRLGHVHEGVHIHLRMDPQILQIGLGDHGAHRVWHPADAQLPHGRAVLLHHAGDLTAIPYRIAQDGIIEGKDKQMKR